MDYSVCPDVVCCSLCLPHALVSRVVAPRRYGSILFCLPSITRAFSPCRRRSTSRLSQVFGDILGASCRGRFIRFNQGAETHERTPNTERRSACWRPSRCRLVGRCSRFLDEHAHIPDYHRSNIWAGSWIYTC
jgi:hypothetical protein